MKWWAAEVLACMFSPSYERLQATALLLSSRGQQAPPLMLAISAGLPSPGSPTAASSSRSKAASSSSPTAARGVGAATS